MKMWLNLNIKIIYITCILNLFLSKQLTLNSNVLSQTIQIQRFVCTVYTYITHLRFGKLYTHSFGTDTHMTFSPPVPCALEPKQKLQIFFVCNYYLKMWYLDLRLYVQRKLMKYGQNKYHLIKQKREYLPYTIK